MDTARSATFDDLLATGRALASRSFTLIVGPYVLLQVSMLLLQSPSWLLNWTITAATEAGYAGTAALVGLPGMCCGFLLYYYVPLVLLGAWTTGVYRVIRTMLISPDEIMTVAQALRIARQRIWIVAGISFVFGLLVVVGCCAGVLPGMLLVFFFAPMLYLLAATDDDLGTALQRSIALVLANPALMLLWLAVVIVVGLGVALVLGVSSTVISLAGALATGLFPGSGALGQTIAAPLCTGLAGVVLGFPMWLVGGLVFATVELKDSEIELAA